MSIKEKYQSLLAEKLTLSSKEAIYALRDVCIQEQNDEYYYLCNLLLIDIFMDALQYDEALQLINHDMTHLDRVTFQNIYVQFLERMIYFHIKKRNFKVAHRYVFEKRKYLDEKNRDQVNRWYLELAYIYAEMNQKTKALATLKSILENLPNDELLSYTLSNLTKLYIDEQMIDEAKDALNQCLLVTHDVEGRIYCNYLFAKICVLEKKYTEALVLYEEMFAEEVTLDYLSMANDYLHLLILLRRHKEAEAFINRMAVLLEKIEDNDVKKEFYRNKLKLLLSRIGIAEGEDFLDTIDVLEKKLTAQEAHTLNENAEINQENEVLMHIEEAMHKIERLIGAMQIAFSNPTLRDILMDYAKKLEKFIAFNDISFVIFEDSAIVSDDSITIYQYKKQRLYEKKILHQQLNQSIVEMMLRYSKEIIIDLTNTNLSLYDLFSGKKYQSIDVLYLFAIPSMVHGRLSLATIYSGTQNDITTLENTILIKIATKLLEKSIENLNVREKMAWAEFRSQAILDYANMYTLIHAPHGVIFDARLAKHLKLKHTFLSNVDYQTMIVRQDLNAYLAFVENTTEVQTITYRMKWNQQTLTIREKKLSFDEEKNWQLGVISFEQNQEKSLLDDLQFRERMQQYQARVNDLEFKFSMIRIKGSITDYDYIKDTFQTNPYFLSDQTFAVILENEVHQRTIDKMIQHFNLPLSIVRYPRDLVQIDDIIRFSKVSLDHGILYFTDDMYQKYIKKVNMNHLVKNMLLNPLELWFLQLKGPQQSLMYEVKMRIKGLSDKENIRQYLEPNVLTDYEYRLAEAVQPLSTKENIVLLMSASTLELVIDKDNINILQGITLVIDAYSDRLRDCLYKLKTHNIVVYVSYHVLQQLSILDMAKMAIKGVAIFEGIDKDERSAMIDIAKQFDLTLFTNFYFQDYEKNMYRTESLVKERQYE